MVERLACWAMDQAVQVQGSSSPGSSPGWVTALCSSTGHLALYLLRGNYMVPEKGNPVMD